MPLSEHSLLLMVVFTGAAVIVLLATTWLSSRLEPFLQTWLAGTVISMIGPFTSAIYYMDGTPWVGAVSFCAITVGFSFKALAAYQFRTGRLPALPTAAVTLAVAFAVLNAILSGSDGLSIILWQGWAAVCSAFAAANYRMARDEAPVALNLLALLYLALGLCFGLSALLILIDGKMALGGPPENVADKASRLLVIIVLIGAGSILLTLNQWRVAGRRDRPAPDLTAP